MFVSGITFFSYLPPVFFLYKLVSAVYFKSIRMFSCPFHVYKTVTIYYGTPVESRKFRAFTIIFRHLINWTTLFSLWFWHTDCKLRVWNFLPIPSLQGIWKSSCYAIYIDSPRFFLLFSLAITIRNKFDFFIDVSTLFFKKTFIMILWWSVSQRQKMAIWHNLQLIWVFENENEARWSTIYIWYRYLDFCI
jgi:hypothetical protein